MKLSVLVEDEAVVVLLRPARYSFERHTKKNERKGVKNPSAKKEQHLLPFHPLVEEDTPWNDPRSLVPIKPTRRDKHPQQERRLRPWWNIEEPPPTTKQHLPRSKTAAKQQPRSEDPFVFLTIPDILFQNSQIAATIRGSSNHNHNGTAIQPKPIHGTTSQDDDSSSASTTTESSSSSHSSDSSSSTRMADLSSTGNTTTDTTLLVSESFDSESSMDEISSSRSHPSHDDNTTFHLDLTTCPPSNKSKILLGDPNCGSSNATNATTTTTTSSGSKSDESTTETLTAEEDDSSHDCSDDDDYDDDYDDESTSTTSSDEDDEDSSPEAFVPQYQWLKLKRQLKVTPKQVHFARTVYIHEVPRVPAQDWDQVFWDANELAEFRHAAFLQDCGLNQEGEVGQ